MFMSLPEYCNSEKFCKLIDHCKNLRKHMKFYKKIEVLTRRRNVKNAKTQFKKKN